LASNICVEKAASGTSSFPPPSLGPSFCSDEVLAALNLQRRVSEGRRKVPANSDFTSWAIGGMIDPCPAQAARKNIAVRLAGTYKC
jgi:hypothetical protein